MRGRDRARGGRDELPLQGTSEIPLYDLRLHQGRETVMAETLDEEIRKKVFLALVKLQDEGCSTEESRIKIAEQFSIDVSEVQDVEREGIAKDWPPL